MQRAETIFIRSSILILLVTAATKIISATGDNHALALGHPLLALTYGEALVLAAFIEVLVAGFLIMGRQAYLKLLIIAWLGAAFIVYRLGLFLVGSEAPCGCLGSLPSILNVSPSTVDHWMQAILAYFVLGAATFLPRSASLRTAASIDQSVFRQQGDTISQQNSPSPDTERKLRLQQQG